MTREMQDFREKQRASAQNPFQSIDVGAIKDIATGQEDDDLTRQPARQIVQEASFEESRQEPESTLPAFGSSNDQSAKEMAENVFQNNLSKSDEFDPAEMERIGRILKGDQQ